MPLANVANLIHGTAHLRCDHFRQSRNAAFKHPHRLDTIGGSGKRIDDVDLPRLRIDDPQHAAASLIGKALCTSSDEIILEGQVHGDLPVSDPLPFDGGNVRGGNFDTPVAIDAPDPQSGTIPIEGFAEAVGSQRGQQCDAAFRKAIGDGTTRACVGEPVADSTEVMFEFRRAMQDFR